MSRPPSSHVVWHPAGADVFVAHAGGEYAGFVSVDRDGYTAADARSRDLGTHPDLALAQRAVESRLRVTGHRGRRGMLSLLASAGSRASKRRRRRRSAGAAERLR